MKFKSSWQEDTWLLPLSKLPGFLLLLLLLHLPPIVATLLCLPTELVAQPAAAALGMQVPTLVSIGTYASLGCGGLTMLAALLGLHGGAASPADEAEGLLDEAEGLESGGRAALDQRSVKVSFKTLAVGWIALSMV